MRQRLCKALILAAVLTLVFGGLEIAARLDVGRTVCIPAMRNSNWPLRTTTQSWGDACQPATKPTAPTDSPETGLRTVSRRGIVRTIEMAREFHSSWLGVANTVVWECHRRTVGQRSSALPEAINGLVHRKCVNAFFWSIRVAR